MRSRPADTRRLLFLLQFIESERCTVHSTTTHLYNLLTLYTVLFLIGLCTVPKSCSVFLFYWLILVLVCKPANGKHAGVRSLVDVFIQYIHAYTRIARSTDVAAIPIITVCLL